MVSRSSQLLGTKKAVLLLGHNTSQCRRHTKVLLLGSNASDAVSAAATASLAPELPTEIPGVGNLAFFKPKDAHYFAKILKEEDKTEFVSQGGERMQDHALAAQSQAIKNGTLSVCKTVLRQSTDKACNSGARLLFDKTLPLLMERTLEDQECH